VTLTVKGFYVQSQKYIISSKYKSMDVMFGIYPWLNIDWYVLVGNVNIHLNTHCKPTL